MAERPSNTQLAKTYRRLGSVQAVAGQLGVAYETARRWLTEAGIEIRAQGRPSSKAAQLDVRELANRYRAGQTIAELGAAYQVSPATIRSRLNAAGIALRPRRGWKY